MKILAQYQNYELPDQDSLNIIFNKNCLKLPAQFNQFVFIQRDNHLQITKNIYHFAASSVGIILDDRFNRLFFKYFLQTPFADVDAFKNMFAKSVQLIDEKVDVWKNFYTQNKTRKKIFFVVHREFNAVAGYIGVDDGDIFINAEPPNSVDILIDAYKENNHIILVALIDKSYKMVRDKLISAGLRENIDFFDMNKFFKVPPETYSFDFINAI